MRKYLQQPFDQYYTKNEVALDCLYQLFQYVNPFEFTALIEPSAGNGSFLNLFDQFVHDDEYDDDVTLLGFDIDPKGDNIHKLDFLKFDPDDWDLPDDPDDIICIGNPPFGDHGKLAKAFFNKCAEFSNHIAFILPQSMLLKSNMRSLNKNFHPVLKIPLSGNPFIVNGQGYDKKLKTVFVYFQNLGYPRPVEEAVKENGNWSFLKKSDPDQRKIADFRIIQNGGRTGNCILCSDKEFVVNKKTNIYTDFFIQVKPKYKKQLKQIQAELNKYPWEFNNLTTWKSLGKNRVAIALNSIIE